MKADLHIHSTISDGSESVKRIIAAAKERGLDAIAVTDHDTLSHLPLLPASGYLGVNVTGGVEISSAHNATNRKAHVLGYNIREPDAVTALTSPVLAARNENSKKQIDILVKNGFDIDAGSLQKADGKYIYKQHIMEWLVSTGQVPDMFGSFYQRTFKHGGVCAFDIEYPDVFDAVRAVKESGGLAVLAHPGQQQIFDLIPELVKAGLDGLELNHHSHSVKDREKIIGCAAWHGLFMTGGSDYHGKYAAHNFGIGDILSDAGGVRKIWP